MIIGPGIKIDNGIGYYPSLREYVPPLLEFLVVGGGGAGSLNSGVYAGGGGGAGGFVEGTCATNLFDSSLFLSVAPRQTTYPSQALNAANGGVNVGTGYNTVFGPITANGGGGGGPGDGTGGAARYGAPGGSGGGGSANAGSSAAWGGDSIQLDYPTYNALGYGNQGGYSLSGVNGGATGGGAGAYPGSGNSNDGTGRTSSITGVSLEYCRGGSGNSNLWSSTLNRNNSGNGSPCGDSTYSGCQGVIVIAYPANWADLVFVGSGLFCNGSYGNSVSDKTSRPNFKVYQFTAGSGSIAFY
jgi:hypothetical protein